MYAHIHKTDISQINTFLSKRMNFHFYCYMPARFPKYPVGLSGKALHHEGTHHYLHLNEQNYSVTFLNADNNLKPSRLKERADGLIATKCINGFKCPFPAAGSKPQRTAS